MKCSLCSLHRLLVAAAVVYLVVDVLVGIYLVQCWYSSEKMAAVSRDARSLVSRIIFLVGEPVPDAPVLAHWGRDVALIGDSFARLENTSAEKHLAAIRVLLEQADAAFRAMHASDAVESHSRQRKVICVHLQDLILAMENMHNESIVSARHVAMQQTFAMLGLSVLVLCILIVLAEILLHNKVLGPIERLSESIAAYACGSTAARAPLCKVEEIDYLAATFNQAADELEARAGALERELTLRCEHERLLDVALSEKETLLRDIHHRVKNNMQVIVSLLNIHARKVNTDIGQVFKECRDRIAAMALIHETLYESSNLHDIDFEAYLQKLCCSLSRAYCAEGREIHVNISARNWTFDTDRCVDIGMILSELISNAYKHAFHEGRSGQISIRLSAMGEDEVELVVADDGPGLPGDIEVEDSTSFGLKLVVSLVQQNLHGTIDISNEGGTRVVMRFPASGIRKNGQGGHA